MRLLNTTDLETLAHSATAQDEVSGNGSIQCSKGNWEHALLQCEVAAAAIDEYRSAGEPWARSDIVAVLAAVLTAGIARSPVLIGGDNIGFALEAITMLARVSVATRKSPLMAS